jgi:hypothetical protein
VAGGTQQQCRGWGAGDPFKVGGCVAGGAAAGRLDVPAVQQQCIAVNIDDSTHALQIMLVFMYMHLGTVVTDLRHVVVLCCCRGTRSSA